MIFKHIMVDRKQTRQVSRLEKYLKTKKQRNKDLYFLLHNKTIFLYVFVWWVVWECRVITDGTQ